MGYLSAALFDIGRLEVALNTEESLLTSSRDTIGTGWGVQGNAFFVSRTVLIIPIAFSSAAVHLGTFN